MRLAWIGNLCILALQNSATVVHFTLCTNRYNLTQISAKIASTLEDLSYFMYVLKTDICTHSTATPLMPVVWLPYSCVQGHCIRLWSSNHKLYARTFARTSFMTICLTPCQCHLFVLASGSLLHVWSLRGGTMHSNFVLFYVCLFICFTWLLM